MHLQDLKSKSPSDLIKLAEEMEVENASSMRKQEIMFAILKTLAEKDEEIFGIGVLEVLQDDVLVVSIFFVISLEFHNLNQEELKHI